MKNLLLVIAWFSGIVGLFAQEDKQLLELYNKSEKDEVAAEQLYEQFEEKEIDSLNPFRSLMKAMSCFYMAKHSGWFLSKLSYFNEGKEALEQAIKKYPNNSSLRSVRLAVQSRAPGILNYDQNMEEDSIFLKKKKTP